MTELSLNDRRPDFVPPPGETIGELLLERGMTQTQLATQMNRPRKTLNEIIKGKAAIEPETVAARARPLIAGGVLDAARG